MSLRWTPGSIERPTNEPLAHAGVVSLGVCDREKVLYNTHLSTLCTCITKSHTEPHLQERQTDLAHIDCALHSWCVCALGV
jgi:hypothetical protein